MGKIQSFQRNAGTSGYLYKNNNTKNLNHCLRPYTKMNSELVIDLNITTTMIELLEKNIGENFCDIGLSQAFLN